jgi:hypothetical protein
MSTRTSAISDDFPHFNAWFGGIPDFSYLANFDKFNCRDQWFKLRQLGDMRYYAHFQYTESENYGLKLILERIEDVHRCRKILKLAEPERPDAYKEWFLERNSSKVNDVWEYRDLPVKPRRVTN